MRVAFDRFVFDSGRRELHDRDQAIHLAPKAFRLLELLIASRPRALRKEDLCEAIWEDTVVDESNLSGLVNDLRTALGDRARKPRFIRTVHGFGYAFCVEDNAEDAAGFVVFRGRQLPLREGINVLGRDGSADVLIDDSTVSRRHATIEIASRSVTLEDLASKNGTFVDGVRLEVPAQLRDGDTFVLGDASVRFRKSATASTVTAATQRARSRPRRR